MTEQIPEIRSGLNPELYSSEVKLFFRHNGSDFPLGQIGPQFIVFSPARSYHACAGEVHCIVDGQDRVWNVQLPFGAVPIMPFTPIKILDDCKQENG